MKYLAAVLASVIGLLNLCALPSRAAALQSFVPLNPPAMKRLTNPRSPAFLAARHFQHGVNLGNYLEVPPGQHWNVTVSSNEFALMRAQGFDHVRVPIGWQYYTGPGPAFRLRPEIFARVDSVVTNALANHLAVIINIHHFQTFMKDPAGQTDKFLAIWRQVAAHYAKFPNALAFELLNEPHNAATPRVMNPLYARAIAEIRRTNPRRTIFVEPGHWGSILELKHLVLSSDDNVIVSVHCYDPMYFTHQGASWTQVNPHLLGIQFPGPPEHPLVPAPTNHLRRGLRHWLHEYNTLPAGTNPCSPLAFEGKLRLAHQWSEYYGRPVHVGEFGCYTTADPASRARYYAAFRRACKRNHLGWAMWDWSAGFRYWNKRTDRPMPGMHRALFGK